MNAFFFFKFLSVKSIFKLFKCNFKYAITDLHFISMADKKSKSLKPSMIQYRAGPAGIEFFQTLGKKFPIILI
jgi:hypothetical protein